MSFKLECVLQLKRELGKLDTVVQLTEISVRKLMNEANKSGDIKKYINEQAEIFKIQTDAVEPTLLINRLSLQYIASVQQYAEYFYYEFRKEYQDVFNTNLVIGDSNESILTKLIMKIPNVQLSKMSEHSNIYFLILEYYRKIRNKYSHQFKITDDTIENAYQEIKKHEVKIQEIFKINDAPNKYQELNFNDFMIFTKALKYFSQDLCREINPNEDVFIDYMKRIQFKKRLKQNDKRYKESIRTFLASRFSITDFNIDKIHTALVAYW